MKPLVSLGTGIYRRDRIAGLRMFLSASVVHFSSVLALSLAFLAPIPPRSGLGPVAAACGLFGLSYSIRAWRGAARDGIIVNIDLDDRIWYGVFPVAAYLAETASGAALALDYDAALVGLALSIVALLVIGIHNAWDMTVWSITRPRE